MSLALICEVTYRFIALFDAYYIQCTRNEFNFKWHSVRGDVIPKLNRAYDNSSEFLSAFSHGPIGMADDMLLLPATQMPEFNQSLFI